ncbi:unnamed protein product [Adineta ricciae]|uniref:Alcohol dehydrogenase iron-type/glycerol dehydrogenase GldA domain-containing protein n=1 Tax=Adineta ricciae TaxID=249248 RepID=A0A814SLB3_ADIRI|nr:unnamed protein product [Adineta ricciae]CAF1148973.1 unnamed protein product [Adineta ricciae]
MSFFVLPSTLQTSTSGTYQPTILRRVEYGLGSLSKLADVLRDLSISKAFIITGTSLATKTDVIEQVKAAAGCPITAVFSSMKQHAPIHDINNAIEQLKQTGSDGILAVGGGSPIDAAKLVIHFYKEQTGILLKLISIPTTLSAAELTIIAGYTNEDGNKVAKKASEIGSSAIILDANLSLSTPNRLWLSTGIRALDHCVEQQYRPNAPIPVRVLAREAAGILFESLRACHKDAKDVEARQRALIGAWLSLWSDDRIGPLGPSHSIGYQLGAPYSIPHGICSCLTLAGTIVVQAKHLPEQEVKQLASLLPFVNTNSSSSDDDAHEQAMKVAGAVKELIADLNLTCTLREYKVPQSDLDSIVERALPDGKSDKRYQDFLEFLHTIY